MDPLTCTPAPAELPWDSERGALACPGCPGHTIASEDDRYELVIDGVGLDGGDEHEAVRVMRRAPGLFSGAFDIPALPAGVPLVAVVDYLERQTFDARDTRGVRDRLLARFPRATLHVWPVGRDIGDRVAEDAYWDSAEGVLIRAPVEDIPPPDYPRDVGWRQEPERVLGPKGQELELWRGCLYLDPMLPDLVKYGWDGLGGPSPPDAC